MIYSVLELYVWIKHPLLKIILLLKHIMIEVKDKNLDILSKI